MTTYLKNRLHAFLPKQESVYPDIAYSGSLINLSRNESRFGFSSSALPAIEAELSHINQYPENTAYQLRSAISQVYGIDPSSVIIGNGSYELLSLAANAYVDAGSTCIAVSPSFVWYDRYTKMFGGVCKSVSVDDDFCVDLDQMLHAVDTYTKVVWLCNPNNPTGTVIGFDQLRDFLERIPKHTLVIVDEAYIEFAENELWSQTPGLIKEFENLILLRTFSKFYGLASLRIGYALANSRRIKELLCVRIPPNHSRIAAAAAIASIGDKVFRLENRERIIRIRRELQILLDNNGIFYIPSQANFLFIKPPGKTEDIVHRAREYGYIIKDASEYGYKDWLRITLGTEEDNFKILKAITGGSENHFDGHV